MGVELSSWIFEPQSIVKDLRNEVHNFGREEKGICRVVSSARE